MWFTPFDNLILLFLAAFNRLVSKCFLLFIVGKAQVLLIILKNQSKWNSAINNCIIYTWAFLTARCQNSLLYSQRHLCQTLELKGKLSAWPDATIGNTCQTIWLNKWILFLIASIRSQLLIISFNSGVDPPAPPAVCGGSPHPQHLPHAGRCDQLLSASEQRYTHCL